jgi:outer membrane protein assembly factor BamB
MRFPSRAKPVLLAERRCFLSDGGSMLSVDAESGALLWKTPVIGPEPAQVVYPVVVQDLVAFAFLMVQPAAVSSQAGATVVALDLATGRVRWTEKIPYVTDISAPVVQDGTIYLGTDRSLIAIDSATGVEQWRAPIDHTGAIAMNGESAYVISGGSVMPVRTVPEARS